MGLGRERVHVRNRREGEESRGGKERERQEGGRERHKGKREKDRQGEREQEDQREEREKGREEGYKRHADWKITLSDRGELPGNETNGSFIYYIMNSYTKNTSAIWKNFRPKSFWVTASAFLLII